MFDVPAWDSGSPRLLVINNQPAFYRTRPFAALVDGFVAATGGAALVAYQVRRAPHSRSEWFYTPDDEFPYLTYFANAETRSARPALAYSPRGTIRLFQRYRPTHVFAAGWDTPLTLAAAAYSRASGARLGVWVESNDTTSKLRNHSMDWMRGAFLRSADFAVVPTDASARFVEQLRKRPIDTIHLLNPVDLARLPDRPQNAKRMLFIGDLSLRKGFDRFVAAARLGADHGWIAEAWGRDTEGLAGQAPNNCRVNAAVPLAEIVPSLESTDVLMIPSRVDPAPLTYSEGLSLGLRIVLSDTVAYREHGARTPGVRIAAGEAGSLFDEAVAVRREPRPRPETSAEATPEYWADGVMRGLLRTGTSE